MFAFVLLKLSALKSKNTQILHDYHFKVLHMYFTPVCQTLSSSSAVNDSSASSTVDLHGFLSSRWLRRRRLQLNTPYLPRQSPESHKKTASIMVLIGRDMNCCCNHCSRSCSGNHHNNRLPRPPLAETTPFFTKHQAIFLHPKRLPQLIS